MNTNSQFQQQTQKQDQLQNQPPNQLGYNFGRPDWPALVDTAPKTELLPYRAGQLAQRQANPIQLRKQAVRTHSAAVVKWLVGSLVFGILWALVVQDLATIPVALLFATPFIFKHGAKVFDVVNHKDNY